MQVTQARTCLHCSTSWIKSVVDMSHVPWCHLSHVEPDVFFVSWQVAYDQALTSAFGKGLTHAFGCMHRDLPWSVKYSSAYWWCSTLVHVEESKQLLYRIDCWMKERHGPLRSHMAVPYYLCTFAGNVHNKIIQCAAQLSIYNTVVSTSRQFLKSTRSSAESDNTELQQLWHETYTLLVLSSYVETAIWHFT